MRSAARARGEQLLVLVLSRRLLDLSELVFEQVELALAHHTQLTQSSSCVAGRATRRASAQSARRVLGAAVGVESLQLGGGESQLAMLVLTVEGDQAGAELTQIGDGHRPSVEVGPGATVGDRASGAEHDVLRATVAGGARRLAAARLGRSKTPSTYASLAPGRQIRGPARPPAEQQIERVRKDGLSGARLAGEDVQTCRKVQFGALNQQKILDAKLL